MNETMIVQKKERINWEELRKEALIYELALPQSLDALSTGQEVFWEKEVSQYGKEKTCILEVTDIFVNPKDTVKVIILGDHRILMFSRMHTVSGFSSLNFDRNDTCDVFENIQKGTWLVLESRYSGSDRMNVAFISNEKSSDMIKEMLETLLEIEKIRYEKGNFKWERRDYLIDTKGTINASEVFGLKAVFFRKLRSFKWEFRKKRWDLMNAVRANLSMKKLEEQKIFEVTAKALDGKVYYLKCPLLENAGTEINFYREGSLYNLDFWLPFVYQESPNASLKLEDKTKELVTHFNHIFHKLPKENFTFGVDSRILTVERKLSKNESLLNYINGKLVKADGILEKFTKFFILGEPILEEIQVGLSTEEGKGTKKLRVMSIQAKKLIEEGLNGKLRDLEGEFPFHLNILYEEKGQKWSLEIGGKKFYVKGGYGALSKVQNAIKGTAILDHSIDSYDSCSAKVIRRRLAELVEDENAVFIILQVKKMGGLIKAMTG